MLRTDLECFAESLVNMLLPSNISAIADGNLEHQLEQSIWRFNNKRCRYM